MARYALLALCLGAAGAAEAWTLDALLQLPLQRLMELQVTAQRTAQAGSKSEPQTGVARSEGADRAT